jgi:Spy/CpxP family protein refolding chaperone
VKSIPEGLQKVQEKYPEEFGKVMPGAVVPVEGPGSKPDLQKMAELVKKVVAENKKGIAEVLKPEQAHRFKQIELQLQGIGALQNGDVVKALALTDEQKRRVKALCEDLASATKFPDRAVPDRDELRKIVEAQKKLFKEAAEKIPSLLTPDQRKKWEELTGAVRPRARF